MSDEKKMTPADCKTPADWGRLAVSIPGWRWWFTTDALRSYGLPGFVKRRGSDEWVWHDDVSKASMDVPIAPDPDDAAVAGCLRTLWGLRPKAGNVSIRESNAGVWHVRSPAGVQHFEPEHLGRACIAAAHALGRWPGGESAGGAP